VVQSSAAMDGWERMVRQPRAPGHVRGTPGPWASRELLAPTPEPPPPPPLAALQLRRRQRRYF